MIVRVLLFGHYRDAVPAHARDGAFECPVPAGATVAALARCVAEQDPRLSDLPRRTRAAVNAEFASPETPLSDGDEVAFLPPMSGG